MKMKNKKYLIQSSFLALVLVALDQLTKYIAVKCLKDKPSISVIEGVFELKYLENTSAAFGMDPISLMHKIFKFDIFIENPELYLCVRMGFFYVFTFAMLLAFLWVFVKIPMNKKMIYLDYILIFLVAGAIGNLIDRASQQYVVDFLYFKMIDFPIFNVADIYVTCASIALVVLGLFYYKDEDIEMIFPSKKEKA